MKDGLIALAIDLVNAEEMDTASVRARRSISTAYYALFHALAGSNADLLAGPPAGSQSWLRVYRALDHGSAKRVMADPRRTPPEQDDALAAFANVFVGLQEQRHAADYDPTASFDLDAARPVVAAARQALIDFAGVSSERRLDLATRLLFKLRP